MEINGKIEFTNHGGESCNEPFVIDRKMEGQPIKRP